MKKKILSPAKAVMKYLLEDVCGSHKELREHGGRMPYPHGRVNLNDIRKNCNDCSGHELGRVRNCHIPECPLYPFRMGKNPNRKGIGNKKGFLNLKGRKQ